MRLKELFEYSSKEDFTEKLIEWIGEVFYDILPEHGYEVREEQVYTAFQLAEAVCNRRVHLAEAGLGTGKTFAYLLTAIAYARFSGKPVVIACASTALQEQLSGPKGDIETLSKLLGITIDARMAKDPRQYICDEKVNEAKGWFSEREDSRVEELNRWISQTKRGERSEIPLVPDKIWKHIGWDEGMACDMCTSRGYCKLVKAREFYRPAKDLIVVDHDIFFTDLWSRDDMMDEGKTPILPSYSAVIFDEGHKVILPAAMRAGGQVSREEIDNIINSIEEIQGAREALTTNIVALDKATSEFFRELTDASIEDDASPRLGLKINETLIKKANLLNKALDNLLLELQIEQELYLESLPLSLIKTFELQIEGTMRTLRSLTVKSGEGVITWIDKNDNSLWVVPRNLNRLLDTYLYNKGLPVVFTSATLSNKGDFEYFSRTLGLKRPTSSTVPSPFDIEEQAVVYLPKDSLHSRETRFSQKIEILVTLLKKNKGSALVLTNSINEVEKIRKGIQDYDLPFEILWEDNGERGFLIRRFREEESTVLVGSTFWEGVDIPGDALTLLVIWQLPFPTLDPLIEVQRKEAEEEGLDPATIVDYPEMGLKLKQGCGRLIRTKDDRGAIVILEDIKGKPWEKTVLSALPEGAGVKDLEGLY